MSMAEFTGQTYGEATRQRESQRAVRPGPPPTEGGMASPPVGGFMDPNPDPNAPITAGLPFGDGPGLEALSPIAVAPGSDEDLILTVRAIAARYPNPAITALLEELEQM